MQNAKWREFTSNTIFDLEIAIKKWNSTKIDPYLVWANITNFLYLNVSKTNRKLPISIELDRNSEYNDTTKFSRACDNLSFIEIPDVYRIGQTPYHYLTALVHEQEFIQALNEGHDVLKSINRFQLGLSVKTEIVPTASDSGSDLNTWILANRDQSKLFSLSPEEEDELVYPIVGIIDDGIGFLNRRFRTKFELSRVRYFWNQNGDSSNPQQVAKGRINFDVPLFGYGYELNENDIHNMDIKSPSSEARHYADLKYKSVSRRVTHGTHMLDLAAGVDTRDSKTIGSDEQSIELKVAATPIIAVQVEKFDEDLSDTSGRWMSVRILDALRYILDRSSDVPERIGSIFDNITLLQNFPGMPDRTKAKRPILVNISYGNLAGPHDGSSILEQAMDELIKSHEGTSQPLSVYMSAGNHRQQRCHACLSVPAGESKNMFWRVYPDDRTPSFMEIWLPDTDKNNYEEGGVELGILAPGAPASSLKYISQGQGWSLSTDSSENECVVVGLTRAQNAAGNRGMFLCALAPTQASSKKATSHPGLWTVCVRNRSKDPIEVNAWIERDDAAINVVHSGKQSHFEDKNHNSKDSSGYPLMFDKPENGDICVEGTLNGIASGHKTTAVDAKRISDNRLAYYCGGGTSDSIKGKSRHFKVRQTNHSEFAEDSELIRGMIASGTLSGSRATLSGTSVAAAKATRRKLENLLDGKKPNNRRQEHRRGKAKTITSD